MLPRPPPPLRWALATTTMLALMISSTSPLSSSTSVPCPAAGFHPDPASCTSFLRCTGPGRGHRYLCPAGTRYSFVQIGKTFFLLRYDPSISNCNHLALAPACNLPIPTQSSPTTTTTTSSTTSSYPESSTVASTTAGGPTITTVATTSKNSSSPNPSLDVSTPLTPSGTGTVPPPISSTTLSSLLQTPPMPERPSSGNDQTSPSENSDTIDETGDSEVLMEENNGGPTEIDESQEEIETVSPMGEGADTGGQFGNNVTQEETEGVAEYLVAAGSAYPCSSPGYFALSGSCREFWVCKEVGPGLLSAERPFRCPNRYLFDPITRLCQREAKVKCQPSLFYSLASTLAIPLREDQLEAFFSSPLTLSSKASTSYSSRLPLIPSSLPLISPVHHYQPHNGIFYWIGK